MSAGLGKVREKISRWRASVAERASATSDPRVFEAPIPARLRAAQLLAMTRLSWPMLVANIGNALVIVLALAHGPRLGLSLIWFGVLALYLTPVVVDLISRRGRPAPRELSPEILRRAALHCLGLGVIWGASPILFVGAGRSEAMIVYCVSVGMLCGGGFCLSTIPSAAFGFLAPVAIGSLAAILSSAQEASDYLAAPLLFSYTVVLVTGVVFSFRSFVDNFVAKTRLELAARHDPLTGLPNRAAFETAMDEALERLGRYGERFALFHIDLNHFKKVNDRFGRTIGDQLLRRIATRLRDAHDGRDHVARLGSDEFAIIARGVLDHSAADSIAADIVARFDAPFALDEGSVVCSVTIGTAIAPVDGPTSAALTRAASARLHVPAIHPDAQAPRSSDETRSSRRRELTQDLKLALRRGDFFLQYQPVYDLRSGRIEGCEALVRWRHPRFGLVPPVEFIGLAEKTGAIHELGEWILNEACREASTWPSRIRISVNVSGEQLCDASINHVVESALRESGLAPQRLQIEVTESASLASVREATSALERMHALGAHIVLDDFGTGFCTFDHIRRLPVSRVKIDRSFVMGLPDNRKSLAIVKSVIALAEPLGLGVTAEGIETEAQRAMLEQAGCGSGQGYLFARPLDAADARALMVEPPLRLSVA